MLTEKLVNKAAAHKLYVQCLSFRACLSELERLGLTGHFPNFERCKADLEAAISAAETPPIWSNVEWSQPLQSTKALCTQCGEEIERVGSSSWRHINVSPRHMATPPTESEGLIVPKKTYL